MYYVKTKREKSGKCNLCTRDADLSWDHVPPKGGIELTPVEMETVFQVFSGDPKKRKLSESQNGVKFRSICQECNSLLGHTYDPIINEFAISVGRYINSGLQFPQVVSHKTRPAALMRGILGHLIAAKADFEEVLFDVQVRDFFFDTTLPIPEQIHIFYWLYPYSQIVVMRDFVMPAVRGNFNDMGFFQVLKYFPVAFLITDKKSYGGLLELTQYRNLSLTDEVEIPIQLDRIEHPYWPEMVDEGNILVGGKSLQSSISARPRVRESGQKMRLLK
ncbi:MAG: hypothetical protein AB7T17_04015 [Geobacter sp.]